MLARALLLIGGETRHPAVGVREGDERGVSAQSRVEGVIRDQIDKLHVVFVRSFFSVSFFWAVVEGADVPDREDWQAQQSSVSHSLFYSPSYCFMYLPFRSSRGVR